MNVGYATLSVIPSLRGFQGAVNKGTLGPMDQAGRAAGRRFGGAFSSTLATFGGLGAAFGVASFIKDSVELEARYSKTMSQMRVATKAPADELKRLDDLAINLGKETVFSAVEASDAMLELAKNGIKPATIEAGGLKAALTLAAAGGLDLESSATAMGNTLNAFRLKGGKAASVAAALAGAANASSASVGSLAEGLQQSSTVAADVGLNVQETTGILAAFANAGIEGSDAGTSLKTMLTRLLPTTRKASNAMRDYGLKFTKSNGEFKSALEIADNLKRGLGDLSAEERAAALNTIFGSDARRAATILTREGAEGLKQYIKATSDQGAAEEMAQANMEGTAGAIERLKGAWETAKLEFGKSIAPVAADFLDYLADNIDDVAPKLVEFGNWFQDEGVPKIKKFSGFVKNDVLPVLGDIRDFAKDAAGFVSDLAGAFGKMPDPAKYAGLAALLGGGAALKVRGGKGALGAVGSALGLAKGTPVYVTNWAQIAGADGLDGGGSRWASWGKSFAAAAGPALAIALGNYLAAKANPDDLVPLAPASGGFAGDGGMSLPSSYKLFDRDKNYQDYLKATGQIDEKTQALVAKVGAFRGELDLVGSMKVNPELTVPGLKEARDGLADFIGKQIDAGRPVTPYINTTSIERAIALARTLDAELQPHAVPNAGVDNGATYQHGSAAAGGNGRVNANIYIGSQTVVAHDYGDFKQQSQRDHQRSGLGGY